MEHTLLRIITFVLTAAVLTLYLYDSGANRVYDVIISAAVLIVTCPLFIVLAAISDAVNVMPFDRSNGKLEFTFPKNALRKLPWFCLVFIGRANIMPMKLKIRTRRRGFRNR